MTPEELRLAIDQAWEQTQKTAPGSVQDGAKKQLDLLRALQVMMAENSVSSGRQATPNELEGE